MGLPSLDAVLSRSTCLVVALLLPGAATARASAPSSPPPIYWPNTDSAALVDGEALLGLQARLASLNFESFVRATASGSGARSCTIRPEKPVSCRKVRLQLRGLKVEADRMLFSRPTGEEPSRRWRAESVAVSDGSLRLRAAAWSRSSAEESTLEKVIVAPTGPGDSDHRRSLVAERAQFAKESVEFKNIELRTSGVDGETDRPEIRVERAVYENGRWSFQGARAVEPVAIPLGPLAGGTPAPTSGVLPPEFRYAAGETPAVRVSGLIGPASVGPYADLAPGRWYGGGLLALSAPSTYTPSPFPDSPTLLRADLRWDQERSEVGWHTSGRAHRGTPLTHVAARLEEVSRDKYWRLERLDRPEAFFRPWRLSRAGASLSDTTWDLQGAFEHLDPIGGGDLAPRHERFGGMLRYTSRHRPTDWLQADLRLDHGTLVARGEDDRHGTTFFAALAAHLDSPGRVRARGGFASSVGAHLLPQVTTGPNATGIEDDAAVTGIDVGSHLQLLGFGYAEAQFAGRFPALTHRITPQIGFVSELVGTDSLPERPAGLLAPQERVADWTAITAFIDQRLEWQTISVALPVGVVLNGEGLPDALADPRTTAGVSVESSRWTVSAGGGFSPERGFDWDGRAALMLDELAVSYSVSDTTVEAHIENRADGPIAAPAQAVRLLQPVARVESVDEPPVVQSLGAAWNGTNLRLDAQTYLSGAAERIGGGLGVGYALAGMGMVVDARTTVEFRPAGSDSPRWGVSLGFVPN